MSKESQIFKHSLESWNQLGGSRTNATYDDYLLAMRHAHNTTATTTPRERHRQKIAADKERKEIHQNTDACEQIYVSTIASMVPDEIIQNNSESSILRSYETALMFIDVSGFTELCENYTKSGRGGPSKLTQVLNSYIGSMVQEILTHNGDVLKFAGDSFLAMWKKTDKIPIQNIVHTAIDCGLFIQKNYGTYVTDLGITLKVKVAIAAGVSYFSIIGDGHTASYIIIGKPVWDVKGAEYMSTAGDVLTTGSVWAYVNETEYITQPCGPGHTKVLGAGANWKRVDKPVYESYFKYNTAVDKVAAAVPYSSKTRAIQSAENLDNDSFEDKESIYKEYSLRPAVITALRTKRWQFMAYLRRFMLSSVLRAVDNEEPIDNLSEVRHVVIVFLNIITKTVTVEMLRDIVDRSYKQVCSMAIEAGGLVNKVSMFDKDMMFLVVFGLRGLKHEDETQNALLCAFQIKETLKDPDILSVSIGVTSGRTYCGVVGHVLRREYTVIGSSVNKAARLMISYQDKVTCDKETFVRSKLGLDMFGLMEPKALKGIEKPGPIYEFRKSGWPERMVYIRHPILGRNEEVKVYRRTLQNAIEHKNEDFTKYKDMRYGIIITGPRLVGKTRLMDEFINISPSELRVVKFNLTPKDATPYKFVRILLLKLFESRDEKLTDVREVFENKIKYRIGKLEVTPIQIYALNTIFDLHFPLPDNFYYSGDFLADYTVQRLVQEIYNLGSPYLVLVAVDDGQYIDDNSWRILLQILEVKSIFIIIVVNDQEQQSNVAKYSMENNVFVKMVLRGIERWYHAALACQLLDVEAIPADLEKILESASGGMPGWIQNFVISLIQRGEMTVVSVPRSEAVEARAVMPMAAMFQRSDDDAIRDIDIVSTGSELPQQSNVPVENENIQMAVFAENYNFNDMKVDMTMDVIILKTYDSLTAFEKIILKCASVIGETFSRKMLLHLLQSDNQRKIAMAVARLFEIRVLECEGGDFSQNTSMVLIHPAPAPLPTVKAPFCACLGTTVPPNCHELPMYAFCGYMKFRHAMFRKTTYELITENQKQEMHAKTLMYLERYTRRCNSCGGGCFVKLFGLRSDDGLKYESREMRQAHQQIRAIAAETRIISETLSDTGIITIENDKSFKYDSDMEAKDEKRRQRQNQKPKENKKRVPSFSSLNLEKCECLPILLSVYKEVIEHIRAQARTFHFQTRSEKGCRGFSQKTLSKRMILVEVRIRVLGD